MTKFLDSDIIRVKSLYPIYNSGIGHFRIGAQVDITIDIEDPNHEFWDLAHFLNGKNEFSKVIRLMRTKHPELNEADIVTGILELDKLRFVEHVRSNEFDDELSSYYRYEGNVNYYSHFCCLDEDKADLQRILLNSQVVLLGLGGIGSNILPVLASVGIGHIICVDYDIVDLSNLNRQYLFRESDIGHLKTVAAERSARSFNSSIKYDFINRKITSPEDLDDIIFGADVVICAIDEPAFVAQRIVNKACIKHGVKAVYGLTQLTAGRLFSILPQISGCFDCLNIYYSKNDPMFVDQFLGFQTSDFDPPTLTYGPDIMQLAAIISSEVVRLINGYVAPVSIGQQVEYNFIDRSTKMLTQWPRYAKECPTCGAGREEEWKVFSYYEKAKV